MKGVLAILFILGTDEGRQVAKKKAKAYIPVTIIVILFTGIYEMFGHGVISMFMVSAGAFPLVMGILFWLLMSRIDTKIIISDMFVNGWTATLFTLMLGFIYKGVLDIYGTYGSLTNIYWLVSGGMFMLALIGINIKPDQEEE